ncbi:MAG: DJ-1/PfpI family protein [Spirochaetes bacterium]|nr:DJ-1/PfpI family protein [Spirochaetota bacterium]
MKKVLLLLANGFEMYEASVFIDVIGWNLAKGDGTTKLATCGMSRQVKSSFDQCVNVDLTIDEAAVGDYDALAIPGGFEVYGYYRDAYSDKFLALIQEFHIMNKIIASVCVGALPVGKSGILKGKKGTTYGGERQDQLRAFGVEVVDEPIVVDGSIITSWDPSTAIDVALLVLELLTSPGQSMRIRTKMGFN